MVALTNEQKEALKAPDRGGRSVFKWDPVSPLDTPMDYQRRFTTAFTVTSEYTVVDLTELSTGSTSQHKLPLQYYRHLKWIQASSMKASQQSPWHRNILDCFAEELRAGTPTFEDHWRSTSLHCLLVRMFHQMDHFDEKAIKRRIAQLCGCPTAGVANQRLEAFYFDTDIINGHDDFWRELYSDEPTTGEAECAAPVDVVHHNQRTHPQPPTPTPPTRIKGPPKKKRNHPADYDAGMELGTRQPLQTPVEPTTLDLKITPIGVGDSKPSICYLPADSSGSVDTGTSPGPPPSSTPPLLDSHPSTPSIDTAAPTPISELPASPPLSPPWSRDSKTLPVAGLQCALTPSPQSLATPIPLVALPALSTPSMGSATQSESPIPSHNHGSIGSGVHSTLAGGSSDRSKLLQSLLKDKSYIADDEVVIRLQRGPPGIRPGPNRGSLTNRGGSGSRQPPRKSNPTHSPLRSSREEKASSPPKPQSSATVSKPTGRTAAAKPRSRKTAPKRKATVSKLEKTASKSKARTTSSEPTSGMTASSPKQDNTPLSVEAEQTTAQYASALACRLCFDLTMGWGVYTKMDDPGGATHQRVNEHRLKSTHIQSIEIALETFRHLCAKGYHHEEVKAVFQPRSVMVKSVRLILEWIEEEIRRFNFEWDVSGLNELAIMLSSLGLS